MRVGDEDGSGDVLGERRQSVDRARVQDMAYGYDGLRFETGLEILEQEI